jgi:hypothetical protein
MAAALQGKTLAWPIGTPQMLERRNFHWIGGGMSAARSGRRQHGSHGPTPGEIERAIEEFARSDDLLLSPDRMREYAGKWVAAFEGDIVAAEADLDSVLVRLRDRSIPLGMTAIRFIEQDGMAAA